METATFLAPRVFNFRHADPRALTYFYTAVIEELVIHRSRSMFPREEERKAQCNGQVDTRDLSMTSKLSAARLTSQTGNSFK